MRVLLVIPAYNEAKVLPELIGEIRQVLPEFDYVIVNDGSKDKTREVCSEYGFNAIHLISNLGIGGAVQAGYKYAYENNYDIAVQVDGDGQHDPARVRELIQPILEDQADFVIGSRFITKEGFQSSIMRRVGISWLNFILKSITKQRFTDATSGMRAASRSIIRLFAANYPYDYPEPETICEVARRGFRIQEVPVAMRQRTAGRSSIRIVHSAYYVTKVTLAILITNIKRI